MSQQVTAGWLLVFSGIVFLVGGFLYTGRAIFNWPVGQTHPYLIWERGFVMAAILTATLGLTLLERLLESAGDGVLAPSGWVIFLIGAVVVIVAEAFFISQRTQAYAPVVVFVALAFLGQALFGAALLRTGLLPAWIGWATILWSIFWLVALPIARPQDMYYPWLHYVAPLLIGVSLLVKR
jgi:hypothetical protein